MTGPFKQDLLKNEKNDPSESSSLKFIWVPLMLLSMFVGFGVTYIAMNSKKPETPAAAATSSVAAAEAPVSLKEKGQQIYTTTCQACHQAAGTGVAGAFPPLDGSDWVLGSPKKAAAIVLHGLQGEITVKGEKYQGVMPPFKAQLSHEDLAAVLTYIRGAWSNKAEAVTVETVNEVFEATKDRTQSWNGEAELQQVKWE